MSEKASMISKYEYDMAQSRAIFFFILNTILRAAYSVLENIVIDIRALEPQIQYIL